MVSCMPWDHVILPRYHGLRQGYLSFTSYRNFILEHTHISSMFSLFKYIFKILKIKKILPKFYLE
jgi:hypothetical protein